MNTITTSQARDLLKAVLAATCLWCAAYSASSRLHADQLSPARDGTQWGIGRLVFARWQVGRPIPPHEYLIGSGGGRIEKEPDHWDLRIDETVEIGLRADGVLVWRRAEKQTSP